MIKSIFIIFILLQGIIMSATIDNMQIGKTKVALIFEKQTTLPIFNLQLVFQNSGYIQDNNQAGLTSLSAKILNEGTLKDGAVKFARKLENKAISLNVSYGFETFVIDLSCLKSEYKTALKLLNQLITNPNLTQDSLDKVKTLQISKLKQKENDFDYIANNQLKKLIFKDTALENSSLGDIKSVTNIQLKDIKNNIHKIFNLDNLIVVAGGDISIDELKKSIQPLIKHFVAQGKTKVQHITANTNMQNKLIKKDTQQSYIYFGSPFNMDSKDKDSYKAKVASFILGGSGFGSRMMEEIRVKRGLAYSAYSYLSIKKSNSVFTGHLQTKLENQKDAKQLVIKIVDDFIKNGVTKKELEAAKKFLLGSEPLRTETFSQRLNRAFHLYYKGLPLDYPQYELQLIENLKLKELNNFIKNHKEIKKLSFAIVTK